MVATISVRGMRVGGFGGIWDGVVVVMLWEEVLLLPFRIDGMVLLVWLGEV